MPLLFLCEAIACQVIAVKLPPLLWHIGTSACWGLQIRGSWGPRAIIQFLAKSSFTKVQIFKTSRLMKSRDTFVILVIGKMRSPIIYCQENSPCEVICRSFAIINQYFYCFHYDARLVFYSGISIQQAHNVRLKFLQVIDFVCLYLQVYAHAHIARLQPRTSWVLYIYIFHG